MASKHEVAGEAPWVLRVAQVWGDTLLHEELLDPPRSVTVGTSAGALFPLAEDSAAEPSLTLLQYAGDEGYRLVFSEHMGGYVWLKGHRVRVEELAKERDVFLLGREDRALVSIGPVAFHIQFTKRPSKLARVWGFRDGVTVTATLLSFLFHSSLIGLLMFTHAEMRDPYQSELSPIARFLLVPPPEDIPVEPPKPTGGAGTETPDPGLKTKEDTGGKKAEKPEGKVGKKDSKEKDTELEGPTDQAIAASVRRKGVLGAIAGGGANNAIARALDIPSLSNLAGGMGAARTKIGLGSGGMGLRGDGAGGGGDGPGDLFGAGSISAGGIGAGKGGKGRGAGGAGAPGKGRGETQIAMTPGSAKSTGSCSRDNIQTVVMSHAAAVRYCYEVEVQRRPSLKGKVELMWKVDGQGAVSTSRVNSSSLGSPQVEGCILRQLKRWRFAKPAAGECTVYFPFIFGVKGG